MKALKLNELDEFKTAHFTSKPVNPRDPTNKMKFTLPQIILSTLLLARTAIAAEVKEVSVPSLSMHTNIPSLIILPNDYYNTNRTYPVIFLLHGYSSNPHMTVDGLDLVLQTAADQYNMILVLPDGGYNSWYIDSPVRTDMKYETFISNELVSFVDANFHSIPHKWARAITGGSMGGFGAMFIGVRHPDTFSLVGELSGAVDFRPFPDNWDIKLILGPFADFHKRWDEYVLINNLKGIKSNEPTIYMDVGTSDAFLSVNRALHNKLLEKALPHVYVERPGHHDAAYWKVAAQYQLYFFAQTFQENQSTNNTTSSQNMRNRLILPR